MTRVDTRPPRFIGTLSRLVVRVFYRRCEVRGQERVPHGEPVLLCANHTSAIADAIILHAACPDAVHPMARSGLFTHPLLGPLLKLQRAVPVYRREDPNADTRSNVDSFERCFALFRGGATLLIFPEGQSHADPYLHQAKTGAARLALGAKARNGISPHLIPVGLTFTEKGRFKSAVLVQFGEPVRVPEAFSQTRESDVRQLTELIEAGMASVTLNLESWEQHDFFKRLERFFALRRAKHRRRSLQRRFRAVKRFQQIETALMRQQPELIKRLRDRLMEFELLCSDFGVHDYHLTVRYTPHLVAAFTFRTLLFLLLILPLALWGVLNSAIPFYLTRHLSRCLANSEDQYDTAKIGLGALFFSMFWLGQTAFVYLYVGGYAALIYALSLPATAAIALTLRRERRRIRENIAVFFLFMRKRDLRAYLELKRDELEHELAEVIRHARRTMSGVTTGKA